MSHNLPPGARHLGRLALYLALQAAVFLAPGAWISLPALAIWALGRRSGISWTGWLRSIRGLLPLILMPAIFGFPGFGGEVAAVAPAAGATGAGMAGGTAAFLAAWAPALRQSAVFLLVLASAAWIARLTSPVELRDALGILLKPLGRAGARTALAASLVLAFIPWTRDELRTAAAAARLRGANPRRRPLRWLAALALPSTVRVLEKAHRSAEALELRGAGRGRGD